MTLTPCSPRVMAKEGDRWVSELHRYESGNFAWVGPNLVMGGFLSLVDALNSGARLGWEVGKLHPINESCGGGESRPAKCDRPIRSEGGEHPSVAESDKPQGHDAAVAGVAPGPQDAMTAMERAARAFCRHGEPNCWETHVDDVRAVLKAIREPTLTMTDAGSDAIDIFFYDSAENHCWRAMIDAALSEGE